MSEETLVTTPVENNEEEIETTDISSEENEVDVVLEAIKKECEKFNIPFNFDEVKKIYEEYSSHGKLGLARDKKEVQKMSDMLPLFRSMLDNYKTIEESAMTAMKPFELIEQMDKKTDEIVDDSEEYASTSVHDIVDSWKKKAEDDETTSIEDVERLIKEMEDESILRKIILNKCIQDYGETHEATDIYDDIKEQLLKDKETIAAGTDPNAKYKIDHLQKTLDIIEQKKFDQYKMMIPKVTSAKAVRGIVKDYFKDNGKLPNKVGFIKKYVDIFTSFFITETEFRSIYSLDERDIRINEIPLVCGIFVYHVSRVVEAERRHENYKAILFKLAVLNIIALEINSSVNKSGIGRWVDDETQTDVSQLRSFVYDEYMNLFESYIRVLRSMAKKL